MITILQSGFWLGVFLLLYKLLFQQFTFFQLNRIYLIVGILVSIVVPHITIENVIYQSVDVEGFISKSGSSPTVAYHKVPMSLFDWQTVLALIYLTGVVVVSFRIVVQFYWLFQKYRSLHKEKQENAYISYTEEPITAFSFFNWIVLNNRQFSLEEQEIMVAHESIHIAQKHTFDVLLSHVLLVWQWFNPFAYGYKKSMLENLEFIADNYNPINTIKKEPYIQLLLKTSLNPVSYEMVNYFNSSLIKKRIDMLHKLPTPKIQQLKYFIILPVVGLLFYAFNRHETIAYVAQTQPMLHDSIAKKMIIILQPTTPDDKLKTIVEVFKKEKATLKISDVKRNEQGEITAISIALETEHAEASFAVKGKKAIKPIQILMDDSQKTASIGSINEAIKEVEWISGSKAKTDAKTETYTWTSSNDDTHKIMEKKIIIFTDEQTDDQGETPKITTIQTEKGDGDGKKFIFISKDEDSDSLQINHKEKIAIPDSEEKVMIYKMSDEAKNGELLIKVNGKIVTEEELKKMNPKEIKDIEIINKDK